MVLLHLLVPFHCISTIFHWEHSLLQPKFSSSKIPYPLLNKIHTLVILNLETDTENEIVAFKIRFPSSKTSTTVAELPLVKGVQLNPLRRRKIVLCKKGKNIILYIYKLLNPLDIRKDSGVVAKGVQKLLLVIGSNLRFDILYILKPLG